MGLLKGPLKRSATSITLVYTEDPDVVVPDALRGCGWVEQSLATSVGPDAEVVTIQGLDIDRRVAIRDIPGSSMRYVSAARAGVTRVRGVDQAKGKSLAEANDAWVRALTQDNSIAAELLGCRVLSLSDGLDVEGYYNAARLTIGVPLPEEVADDGSPKSGE